MNKVNPSHQGSRPPVILSVLFFGFAAAALFNIFQGLSSAGIKPFGFIEQAFAQFAGRPAPNAGQLVEAMFSGESKIQDTLDRCEIMDPNLPGGFAFAAELGNAGLGVREFNLAGVNIGAIIDGAFSQNGTEIVVAKVMKATFETAEEINGSYVLGIVTNDEGVPYEQVVESTALFIKEATSRDLRPIVRLCIPSRCNFPMDSDPTVVSRFYIQVQEKLREIGGGSSEFIAMVGPNEPGTAGEMEAFGFPAAPEGYLKLLNAMNTAAENLKEYRVVNGGTMYLAPGAFNLTNQENNDAAGLIGVFGPEAIMPGLYDYIIGNTYNVAGTDAYGWYDGSNIPDENPYKLQLNIQDYVARNNLKAIITEFGKANETGEIKAATEEDIAKMREQFEIFCSDDTVEGVLFFRSFEELVIDGARTSEEEARQLQPVPAQDWVDLDTLKRITSNCSFQKKIVSNRDFAWTNCNIDSCSYEQQYDDKSTATICGKEFDADAEFYSEIENGAALKVDCSSGLCVTKMLPTLEVQLPIKQFGNNTSAGTASLPFTPICAEVANYLDNQNVDALNQFAGALTDKDSQNIYAMPWLGNAINCASQLVKAAYDYPFEQEFNYSFTPHQASFPDQTYAEIFSEINELSTKSGSSQFEDFGLPDGTLIGQRIIDERSICTGYSENGTEICLDKALTSATIRSLREYNPFSNAADTRVIPTNACTTDLSYKNDVGNYVIGPEIKLQAEPITVSSFGANQLCLDYAKRNTSNRNEAFYTNGQVNCSILAGQNVETAAGNVITCPTDLTCDNGGVFVGDPENPEYHKGNCIGVSSALVNCIRYDGVTPLPNPAGSNSINAIRPDELGVYYKTLEYPEVPEYEIPGMYDALYRMYLRLQAQLNSKGQKMVFRENIGMQSKVSVKIRDANRPTEAIGMKRPYLYKQQLPACTVDTQMFDNEYMLAKNNPIKTEYQYYDWLGYLDIIQEQSSVNVSNNTLSDLEIYENPLLTEPTKYVDPVSNTIPETLDPTSRQYLYESGDASLMTTFPIPSCDDVEIQKYDSMLSEDQRLDAEAKITCLTDMRDERFEDELGEFLCKKGYSVPGKCNELVCKPAEVPTTGTLPDGSVPIDEEDLVIYPVGTDLKIPAEFCGPNTDIPNLVEVNILDRYYYPEDSIDPGKDPKMRLEAGAANALTTMLRSMQSSNPNAYSQCAFNWGYRDSVTQGNQPGQCGAGTGTACACESEHQLGTAVDFRPPPNADGTGPAVNQFNSSNACFNWLNENAHQFGFVRSYLTGNPDGYIAETWHWRWIGTELSREFNVNRDKYEGHLKNFLKEKFTEVQKEKQTQPGVPNQGLTCPVAGGYCIQGPGGTFSHTTLNAIDLKGTDQNILAPFDGKIVEYLPGMPFRQNYCRQSTIYDAGDGFAFEGVIDGKTYRMLFYHADVRGANLKIGDTFRSGQRITRMATFGDETLDGNKVNSLSCQAVDSANNQHLHLEFYQSTLADPQPYDMGSFAAALGCSVRPVDFAQSCVVKENIDLGSQEIVYQCTSPTNPDEPVNNSKRTIYPSFNELVQAVANFIAAEYGNAYPFDVLLATAWIESRLVTPLEEGSRRFNGDPLFQSHLGRTDAGESNDVRGPMQFELGTWNGITQNQSARMSRCLESLGMKDYTITPDSRTYLGPALCAAAIKHNENIKFWLGERDYSEITSKEDWFEQKFPSNYARANWGQIFFDGCIQRGGSAESCAGARAEGDLYDVVNYQLSPIHIISRRYYGACLYQFGSNSGDYCSCVYNQSAEFIPNRSCNENP